MRSDIEIAQAAKLRRIVDVATEVGLDEDEIEPYGRYKAKLSLDAIAQRGEREGSLVLVTGTNPTPAGEGKSTISVGLADGLRRRQQKVVLCLREPSLGPVFGIKGGAAGGGYSQVVPMEDINLHFTGDSHAVTSSHALLSAMLDNHLHHGNKLGIDPRRITWKRAVDVNDRALRRIVVGLGGPTGGMPREDAFMISAASEVMAILALAADRVDLEKRLGSMLVGYTRARDAVYARDLHAEGAMALLLKDAIQPNLVQTLEGTPALVHCGPFGNIAHGCNSLIATDAGLALGDVVVTEAGFGADLGAEKFFDIKCRTGGLRPALAVVVATVRSLKMHGGGSRSALGVPDAEAVARGIPNLEKHVANVKHFGVPPIIAINRFEADTDEEIAEITTACRGMEVPAAVVDSHALGGAGTLALADAVIDGLRAGGAAFKPLYPLELPLARKIETIARDIYGADGVDFSSSAERELAHLERIGLANVPICIAKTQYSLSDDPNLLGRPTGFRITVREVTPSAGAGFVVAHTGDIMTLPGLPRQPAAEGMRITQNGDILGLF